MTEISKPALTLTRRAALLGAVSVLAACAKRGEINFIQSGAGMAFVDIMVATNRARAGDGSIFSGQRDSRVNFAEITVSIPPAHRPGEVELPRRRTDPNKHFGVTDVSNFQESTAFSNQIARRALSMPPNEREAVVFVHGFNNTFAEALYRFAQMYHDFKSTGIPILFSWPSSGEATDYLYDRDSVLFARNSLEELMDRLENSQISKVQLVGHSMGSHLIVEALRQRAIRNNGQLWSKLQGVILISPDIDIDVFAQQAEEIGNLPQPFVIVTSNKDRALQLSAWANNSRARLGSIRSSAQLDELPIIVIDTTDEASRLGANHMTFATSPAIIAFLQGVREQQVVDNYRPSPALTMPRWIAGDGVQ